MKDGIFEFHLTLGRSGTTPGIFVLDTMRGNTEVVIGYLNTFVQELDAFVFSSIFKVYF